MKYLNTLRDKSNSDYARIEPSFDGAVLHFATKNASPNFGGQIVHMVKANARLSVPSQVEVCGEPCGVTVTAAAELTFNIVRGDVATLTALRTELNRVVDEAIADFQFANGLVPTGNADFAS